MTKQKTSVGELEPGVVKVLEVLLEVQTKYTNPMQRYFAKDILFILAKEKGEFTGQFGKDEVESYIERADQRGYLEKIAFHTRVGCRSGMLEGYRIREDKVPEVKRLLGK